MEKILKEINRCFNCKNKPCTNGCPLNNNIPDVIQKIKENKYEEAYKILTQTTVLPSICGRICPYTKQCENHCTRGIKENPVDIGSIEAFLGDLAIEQGWKINLEEEVINKEKIAIIGGGPAGLTCAAFLKRYGYNVTIYEKHNKLGGLIEFGIPKFRLNEDVIKKGINQILKLGIEVKYNQELGKTLTIKELKEEYDAIFISVGANKSTKMNILGEDLEGVYGANELLENRKHPDYTDKIIIVNGGGDVAIDTARTIKRLNAKKVIIVYRRSEEEMPAEKEQIELAKEEGIEFSFQNNIVKIIGKQKEKDNKEHVSNIELIKTKLEEKEGQSRKVPIGIIGSNYIIDADYIIMAIGATVNDEVKNEKELMFSNRGYVEVNKNQMTNVNKVFAGGEVANSNKTVAWASRSGRDAAYSIMKYIKR